MSKDEYTKLFIYMEKRFNRLEAELAKKADTDPVYAAFDALIKRIENVEHEVTIHSHVLSRHEGWIKELATNTGTPLASS